jgi:hypothetical protein
MYQHVHDHAHLRAYVYSVLVVILEHESAVSSMVELTADWFDRVAAIAVSELESSS